MRILMTGATGVIGRHTIPLLLGAGHEVRAVARTRAARHDLRVAGAEPVSVNLFDRDEIRAAVDGCQAVLHFATSIPPLRVATKARSWVANDRLRDDATNLLVDAAISSGVERFVLESMTFFYTDRGEHWVDESSPVDATWRPLRSALAAERHLKRFTESGAAGVTLRFAQLYGPGDVSLEYLDAIRQRRIPLIGHGDNFVPRVHIADAATAILASLAVPPGTYNVSDDDPQRARATLEQLVGLLDAPRPRRLPTWLAKVAGGSAVSTLTRSQRVSNQRLRSASAWTPIHGSSADGWPEVVQDANTTQFAPTGQAGR
ncbi:MAG: NAD(P)-dependent oxidoreductase [Actinomycetota bacterium]